MKVFHVADATGAACCSGALLVELHPRELDRVPETLRCRRRGCRERWPQPAPVDEVFEFEVHVSTNDDVKRGVLATTVTKVVAAAPDWWTAYKTAVDVAWRGPSTPVLRG